MNSFTGFLYETLVAVGRPSVARTSASRCANKAGCAVFADLMIVCFDMISNLSFTELIFECVV